MVVNFERPIVSVDNIIEIAELYPFGKVLNYENLGGVPNVTYRVTTVQRDTAIRVYNKGYSSLQHIELELSVLQHLVNVDYPYSPRLLAGNNGSLLQEWHGYKVCATDFIPGQLASEIEITPRICQNVGASVAILRQKLHSYPLKSIPTEETFVERGSKLINALDATLKMRNWKIDVSKIPQRWENTIRALIQREGELKSTIIHADIWPPNVICKGEEIAGVIDFDDCCFGPAVLDVCVALGEFTMFNSTVMKEQLVRAFFRGYFEAGGMLSETETQFIIAGMEAAFCVWLACNAIQASTLQETAIYLEKLNMLEIPQSRQEIAEMIQTTITNQGSHEL